MNPNQKIQISCPIYQFNISDRFSKIVIIDNDSYKILLDLLTPEQSAELIYLAQTGQFKGISGRIG